MSPWVKWFHLDYSATVRRLRLSKMPERSVEPLGPEDMIYRMLNRKNEDTLQG